jgi:energy-coupling factor transporter ATP-binding protein EcfA2
MTESGRMDGYIESLGQVLDRIRGLGEVLPQGESAESPGVEECTRRRNAFVQGPKPPVVVATLYGPSGSGKSTLFNLFTKLSVPAGVTRPFTRSAVVAVPPQFDQPTLMGNLFPGFQVEKLDDVGKLKVEGQPRDHLFYVPYQPSVASRLNFVLVDVPDFNSVERSNWEKAEAVLKRAELVVFAVSAQGYADLKVMQELARCCRESARMAFVLTRVEPGKADLAATMASAKHLYDDLLANHVTRVSPEFDFAETRSDGRTLREFLASAFAYVIPHALPPTLDDVHILKEGSPPLTSLLEGLEAERIVLEGLIAPVRELMTGARRQLAQAAERRQLLETTLARIRADVRGEAERGAANAAAPGQGKTPFDDVLAELERLSNDQQSGIIRVISWPRRQLFSGVRSIGERLKSLKMKIPSLSLTSNKAVQTTAEERLTRIATEVAERLVDRWRFELPEKLGVRQTLSAEACRGKLDALGLPPVDGEWNTFVQEQAKEFLSKNKALSVSVALFVEATRYAGLGAIVVDLLLTGGIVSGLGGMALGGLGTTLLGEVGNEANQRRLRDWAKTIEGHWKTTAANRLQTLYDDRLIAPLFATWATDLQRLPTAEDLDRDRTRIDDLERRTREVTTR